MSLQQLRPNPLVNRTRNSMPVTANVERLLSEPANFRLGSLCYETFHKANSPHLSAPSELKGSASVPEVLAKSRRVRP